MGLEGAFTGGLANRPLPALAAHHRFVGEFCCTAISLLLLGSVPAPGEWPALLDLSPCPDPGRPQSRDVCEIPHGMQIGLRRFQDLGEAVSSRRNRSRTGHKGLSWGSCKRNCSSHQIHPFPCRACTVGPWDHVWGSGAGPVQDRALTGATKQLPGGDRLELVAARKVKSKNQSFNRCVRDQG